MKHSALTNIVILILVSLAFPAVAALSPGEVVVVYNSSDEWNVWNEAQGRNVNVSKAVADYYCLVRDIPAENEVGIPWDYLIEAANPADFFTDVVPGLRSFLAARPGFDINDPGSDPTKAIVLCYGVPVKLTGGEAASAVDSSLTLLFNTTPWGRQPVSDYRSRWYAVPNPFRIVSYVNRRYDFGDFRASAGNAVIETAPSFHVVRMLSPQRAVAGGSKGALFLGEKTGDTWSWTAIPDEKKQFIRGHVTDICVVDASTALAATGRETSPSACLRRAFGDASCRQGGIGGPPQAD